MEAGSAAVIGTGLGLDFEDGAALAYRNKRLTGLVTGAQGDSDLLGARLLVEVALAAGPLIADQEARVGLAGHQEGVIHARREKEGAAAVFRGSRADFLASPAWTCQKKQGKK